MKYVGVKQVLKAIENGEVSTVYVGKDAVPSITEKVIKLCKEKNIELKLIDTMDELREISRS